MIPFNKTSYFEKEKEYLFLSILNNRKNTSFCAECEQWISQRMGGIQTIMTNSCSSALDMTAQLLPLKPGDEVILPSFTFASTANAFVKQGVVPVFVDIRPDTMNIDEQKIQAAITKKTQAIVVMHYAGVACEMDTIMQIAEKYRLPVIEDAAQAMLGTYKGKPLGTIGSLGCFSFHETKNFSMGEGGALLFRDDTYYRRAEIIGECGTSRKNFLRGETSQYTWLEAGSSYMPNELGCAHLYAQLEQADEITKDRLASWNFYYDSLKELEKQEKLRLPFVPKECKHNGHIFYIRTHNRKSRDQLLAYLAEREIYGAFHYIPLHSSLAGRKYGRFHGEDRFTTAESEKLLRLPLYYQMGRKSIEQVIEAIYEWFPNKERIAT